MTIESVCTIRIGSALILNQFDGIGGAALVAAGWGVWHLISDGACRVVEAARSHPQGTPQTDHAT